MIVARLALFGAALAICVGYALGVRAVEDQSNVNALLDRHLSLTAGQARTAEGMLSDAKILNPDPAVDVLRAEVEFHAGHVARAVSIAKDLVRRAPQDVDGWLVLALLTEHFDPALNTLAHARLAVLIPPR